MVGPSNKKGGLSWKPFVYGGLASVVAETGTFPIDTTKTRLQVQGQLRDAKFRCERYRGMLHALKAISCEEGVGSLYSGVKPAILRQLTYGTIKFGIYYSLKSHFVKDTYDDSLALSVVFGVSAGVVAASLANPTDLLKVRMQAQNVANSNLGMWHCFREIYRAEGIRGLWKGVCPTAQRAAVCAGVELPVYDITKKHLLLAGLAGDTPPTHFMASFVAGLAGALASNPIDVVRTRLMNQRRMAQQGVMLYSGVMDCAVQTVRGEGFLALYRGFIPTWVRLGPWNIIFFLVYEQLQRLG